MIRLRRAVATMVLGGVLLAGCSSEGDAELTVGAGAATDGGSATTVTALPEPTGPVDTTTACGTISAGEIGQVLGNPVRGGQGAETFCSWGTSVDRGTSAHLTVVRPAAGRVAQACDSQKNSQPKEATHDRVENVGTSGLWVWQPLTLLLQGTLVTCWDDSVIVVGLTGEKDQSVLRNQAVALAKAVHDRL
ncbi:MAG TPA: hypothetical protein VF045_02370 [Acidimicrobiales bacterium]